MEKDIGRAGRTVFCVLAIVSLVVPGGGALHSARNAGSAVADAGNPAETTASSSAHFGPQEPASVGEMLETLDRLAPDAQQTARVSSLVIERPGGRLNLESGELTLLQPVLGRTVGAVFVGELSFRFEPATEVEKLQVERFYDAKVLDVEAESLVLFFSDSTLAELRGSVDFGPGTPSRRAESEIEDALELMFDPGKGYVEPVFGRFLLNAEDPALFDAHIEPKKGRRLRYRFDQSAAEAVVLSQRRKVRSRDFYETISSYAPAELGDLREATADRVAHYGLDVTFDDGLDMEATASVVVRLARRGAESGRWIPFTLHSKLEVDSVAWNATGTVPHFRGKETSSLWVYAPAEVVASGNGVVNVSYHGDFIEKQFDFHMLRSSTGWYPKTGIVDATFAMTFHVPEKYAFVGSGKLISEIKVGETVTTQWLVDNPWVHASFNVGDFEEYNFAHQNSAPIRLQVAEKAHRRIQNEYADRGYHLLAQKNPEEQVGQDIALSMTFFNHHFGSIPVDTFYVTEIPYSHGQAFPSMVQLSWATYQWTSKDGGDEAFRAHEVAHQWWGGSLRPATYHDTWLSEGLAEFSGLWYMEKIRGNTKLYSDYLEKYRENILERRGEAGPIWLGSRLYTSETEADYQIMTYQKGAWVVHMLRQMVASEDGDPDANLSMLLKEFHQANAGRSVRTEDFEALLSERLGVDMTWFFDQWVRGTEVPTYRWAWTGSENSAGEYVAKVRVRQSGVSEDFKMIVPLLLDFGADGWAPYQMVVEGPVTDVELPPLPRKPDDIVFNHRDAVLAEVKSEGW